MDSHMNLAPVVTSSRHDPNRVTRSSRHRQAAITTALLVAVTTGLCACGAVPFLDRDPSLPRDRASRFDRFVDEVQLSLGDTATPLEWAQQKALWARSENEGESTARRRTFRRDGRRKQLLRQNLERHLLRLEDEFPPTRLGAERGATARILSQDLRRALDLADADDVATASPALPPRVPSVWSGPWTESPSILLREHPARTAEQLRDWLGAIQWMADSDDGFPDLSAEAFEDAYGPRGTLVAKALFADVSRRQASTGSGLASDPFMGPLAEARAALSPPERARLAGFDEGPLQRALRAKTNDWFSAVRDLQRALDGRNGARTVTYLTGSARDRWIRRLRDAAGPTSSAADLNIIARAEVVRLTIELGESLGLEDPSDLEATRTAFAQIRSGSRVIPGANLPVRSPSELEGLLAAGTGRFVAAPPPVLLASAEARTFERPHGRGKPVVPGDLRPVTDPVARPSLYLRPSPEDATIPRWLWEAEAIRYGNRGEALADAYRRAAVDQPLYLRAAVREIFESAWGLYATAEVFRGGDLLEVDRGFGWRVQELSAFAAVIVDLGMHDRGWSHRQALDAFLEMTPLSEPAAREVILRSICEPGRDASAGLALTLIRDLRFAAKELQGEDFRADLFHAALLTGGPIPMSEVQGRIEASLARWTVESRR